MRIAASVMVAGLFVAGPLAAQSQSPTTFLATQPARFESWNSEALPREMSGPSPTQLTAVTHRRGRNALIGGAVGTVAGLVVCTVISNLINDPGSGFSTCTRKGYLLFGGAGFAVGFVIGLISAQDHPPP